LIDLAVVFVLFPFELMSGLVNVLSAAERTAPASI